MLFHGTHKNNRGERKTEGSLLSSKEHLYEIDDMDSLNFLALDSLLVLV